MRRKTNTVPVYEAHLSIPNHDGGAVLIDFKADDLSSAQECIQRQFAGGASFEPSDHASGAAAALLVFHPDYGRGELPIGWIQLVNTPVEMTPRATIEQRLQAARAA
jgi:hypothetical protein